MKKKYSKLLILLPICPLLMANSPAPAVYPDDYKDYQITYVKEEKIADDKYNYVFNFKNTGDGYINYIYLNGEEIVNGEEMYYGLSLYDYEIASPFADGLLPPGFNGEVTLESTYQVPNPSKLKHNCQAYTEFYNDATIEGTKELSLNQDRYYNAQSDIYYYNFDIKLSDTEDGYYYGVILKLNYDGEICYVKTDQFHSYQIVTNELLDLSKISVEDIKVIRTVEYNNGFGQFISIVVIVFVVGLLLLFAAGIFAAIFFPLMAARRRRRAVLLAEKNK